MTAYVATACLVAVGLVYAGASLGKLAARRRRSAAVDTVLGATGWPRAAARAGAAALIAVEATVPVMLVLPATRSGGIWLAVLVSTGLLGGVLLLAGREVRCACFGGDAPLSARHAVRNAVLLATALGSAAAQPVPLESSGGLAAAVVGVVVCAAIVLTGNARTTVPASARP